MKARRNGLFIIFVLTLAAVMIMSGQAYAGNATRMIGYSSRDSGMAGATTASSADTSCLVRNPAGLVWIGNRIDAEYLNILPRDVTMHTEGPNVAALGNVPFVNAGLRQKSLIDYLPGFDAGISYRLPGTDAHPVSVGCGIFTMAGVAVKYPSSRINSAFTGDYDKMADLRSMRVASGIAAAITDNLSFGATANIGIQGLRANLAKTDFTQTAGGGDWDFAAGAGYTLGLLYKLNEMLSLGASYESHGWFQHHHKYKDVLPMIDEPQVVNIGISLKPIKEFEFTYDTRYINWTGVKILKEKPDFGGFGWQDQWVFAFGGEYTVKNKKDMDFLKLRMGYMYGKSPIQPHVIFANALLPVIMEHHLTMGVSYYLTKSLTIDLAWEHHFKKVLADNGLGDIYSQYGCGTKISAAADIIGVGLGYSF